MVWYIAILWGALGGLAKTLYRNDGGLELPKRKTDQSGNTLFDLGFLADVGLGAVAAVVAQLMLEQGLVLTLEGLADAETGGLALKGFLPYFLAGWFGGAFIDKRALNVEKAKVNALSQIAAAATQGAPVVQDVVKATHPRDIALLQMPLLNLQQAAAAKQPNE